MKPNIHPEYRTVVFHDTSVDEYFKIGSTIKQIARLNWTVWRIHMWRLTFPQNRIRSIPVNLERWHQKAMLPALLSVLVVLLGLRKVNDESA